MSEPILIQTLIDGSLDAKSLAEAANGDENTTVTTRLGETYPSAKKAIKTMFENGGLPATPFATKALMTASTLVDGKYAMVTNDTVTVDNGLYVKTAGAWVKSGYDPVTQAIDAAALLTDKAMQNTYGETTPPGDLVQIQDDNFNMLFRIDKNKKAYVSGMTESLQDKLNVAGTPSLPPRKSAHRLSPSALSTLSYLPYSGLNYAPCPMQMLPQMYTVADTELQKLTITDAPQQLVIDTPYNLDDKVVHPSIVECYGSFRGYRYIMLINPYVTAFIENPLIYGSNDLVNFELLDGFVQPLDFAPHQGYLSDVNLSYDPINGELLAIYSASQTGADGQMSALKARTTRNGIDWSEPFFLSPFELDQGSKMSSATLYNPDTHLFYRWQNFGNGETELWTAPTFRGTWTMQYRKRLPQNYWHQEVKYIGNRFVMVYADSEGGSNYGIMSSDDGYDWTYQGNLFPTNQSGRYKGSYLVEMDDDTNEFNLFFIWTDNILRKAFTARTNKIAYQELS